MNVAQQIKSFTEARAAEEAVIKGIMEASATSGESLDAETEIKYDEAKTKIGTIDKHLARLRESEVLLATKATPVTTTTSAEDGGAAAVVKATEERAGHQRVIAVEKKLDKGIGFARFVKCMAMGEGNARNAFDIAKEAYPNEVPLHNILKMHIGQGQSRAFIEKTAVAGALTTNSAWAGALVQYQDLANDFIEFLRPKTILGRLPGLRNVPFKVRVKRQTGGSTANWVGEGKAAPLSALAFDTVTLDFTKLAALAVIPAETLRLASPSADVLVRDDLAASIIQQSDSDFIDPANAGTSNIKPASVTNGVSAVVATGTTTQAGIATDVLNVFSPWISANIDPTGGAWIMSPTTAMALSLMVNSLGNKVFNGIDINGGMFQGLPVIVSQAAGLVGASDGAHIVVLVHAPSILLADDGQVAVDVSFEASLEMSDAPANSAATGTGASVVSMFQTDSAAIRATRWVNWVKGRSQAVQYLSAVHWGGFPV